MVGINMRSKSTTNTNSQNLPSLSILVCAKNEYDNLTTHLPQLLNIEYPAEFELIVVNDGSLDASLELLQNFQKKYPALKIINIPPTTAKDLPGKKYALREGLRQAKYENVLLTDADCYPTDKNWAIAMMQRLLQENADVVLGFGNYEQHFNSNLNKFIRWETLHTAIQYMSYAVCKMPYMGVGRNLLYKKSKVLELFANEVFIQRFKSVPSGDDDLIINALAEQHAKITIATTKDSITMSKVPLNTVAWIHQKRRHVSSGKLYPVSIQLLLGMYALTHTLFWMIALSSIFVYLPNILMWGILFRGILAFLVGRIWSKKLNSKEISYNYLIGDLGWAIYNVFLSPYIFRKNKYQWK